MTEKLKGFYELTGIIPKTCASRVQCEPIYSDKNTTYLVSYNKRHGYVRDDRYRQAFLVEKDSSVYLHSLIIAKVSRLKDFRRQILQHYHEELEQFYGVDINRVRNVNVVIHQMEEV